jgi:hypothetical protein
MLFVYIAGPLTKGDRLVNIRKAVQAASRIRNRGHVPFVPHLYDLLIIPKDYEYWSKMDLEWIQKCDVLIRLEGVSSGVDREVEEARRLDRPVFFGLQAFMESEWWAK